jgi:hypothetical protein
MRDECLEKEERLSIGNKGELDTKHKRTDKQTIKIGNKYGKQKPKEIVYRQETRGGRQNASSNKC